MISCLFLLILCGLMLLLSRHLGRVLCYTIVIPSSILLIYFLKEKNLWLFILQIIVSLLILFIYAFAQSKINYDYTGKIISFTYIFNSIVKPRKSNGDRIIGRVLPYSKYQLKYNGKYICVNEITTAGATLISGSTGSGKTTQALSFIKQNIVDGKSVIFTEYKGNPEVVNELVEFANLYDFEVYNLSNGKSNFNYDPLQNLNNVGRIEALMNMRKWSMDGSDAHYKTSTQLLLQKLIGIFSHKYSEGSFTFEFLKYVKSYHPNTNEWDAYNTISKLLELLLTSSLEPMFKGENEKELNFHKIKNKRFLLIVSFISSNKELATSFSSLMFRDLLDECTTACPNQNINLYSDEFGTLENPFIIKDLLEKGRSAKIATTLTLLDINQIIIQTNQAYLDSILGIINTFIIYNGATRVTAEKFAGVQLLDIEGVLMNLRKPINGHSPTAIYISKYPTLNRKINSEVFRFEPYICNGKSNAGKSLSFNNFDPKSSLNLQNKKGKISEYNESSHMNENEHSNKKIDMGKSNFHDEIYAKNEDVYNDFI